jgi:hypothetical protein
MGQIHLALNICCIMAAWAWIWALQIPKQVRGLNQSYGTQSSLSA